MHILVVNPNTSAAMTDRIRESAEQATSEGATIVAVRALRGPPEITSPAMAAEQGPVVVDTIEANAEGIDAAVIAAFSDPGLKLAQARFTFPVVGIGEAVLTEAWSVGRFVLIVPNPANQSIYEAHVKNYGVADRFLGIRYLYPALPHGKKDTETIKATLIDLVRAAIAEDKAEAVAIGGGPLSGFGAAIADSVAVPVFESISSAIGLAVRRVSERSRPGESDR